MEFFLSFKSFKRSVSRFIKLSNDAQTSWNNIFLCQFPLNFFDYNNIFIFMKKDA